MAALSWRIWSAFVVAGLIVLASIVYILIAEKRPDMLQRGEKNKKEGNREES